MGQSAADSSAAVIISCALGGDSPFEFVPSAFSPFSSTLVAETVWEGLLSLVPPTGGGDGCELLRDIV